MCGIAGFNRAVGDSFDGQAVAFELLRGIEQRGTHATGVAFHDVTRNKIAMSKLPVPATRWITERGAIIPSDVDNIILHTRFATQGTTARRGNNHPIASGDVVGVHNGIVRNDDDLFRLTGAKRHAEVDSEAIMALIDTTDLGHPTETLGLLKGDAALAWIKRSDPTVLHLARVVGRPLYIAQSVGGTLLFASSPEAVHRAAKAGGLVLSALAGQPAEAIYLRVKSGVIHDHLPIEGVDLRPMWRDPRADGKAASKGKASKPAPSFARQPSRDGGPQSVKMGKRARREASRARSRDAVERVLALPADADEAEATEVQRRALSILADRMHGDLEELDGLALAEAYADAEVEAMDEMNHDRRGHAGRFDMAGTNDTSRVVTFKAPADLVAARRAANPPKAIAGPKPTAPRKGASK